MRCGQWRTKVENLSAIAECRSFHSTRACRTAVISWTLHTSVIDLPWYKGVEAQQVTGTWSSLLTWFQLWPGFRPMFVRLSNSCSSSSNKFLFIYYRQSYLHLLTWCSWCWPRNLPIQVDPRDIRMQHRLKVNLPRFHCRLQASKGWSQRGTVARGVSFSQSYL